MAEFIVTAPMGEAAKGLGRQLERVRERVPGASVETAGPNGGPVLFAQLHGGR